MGSDAEFEMMLHFCDHHHIIPWIDSIHSLEDAAHAFSRMDQGQQFGKIVLHHAQKV
jgi:zinc-binding alcohol dehydrogenase/oxidoreductase